MVICTFLHLFLILFWNKRGADYSVWLYRSARVRQSSKVTILFVVRAHYTVRKQACQVFFANCYKLFFDWSSFVLGADQ